MTNPSQPQPGRPAFEVGQRVNHGSEGSGRIQSVSRASGVFSYRIKWDVGRESVHPEPELSAGELPPQYP